MNKPTASFWMTPKGIGALGLIGAASYFLLVEHRQHLFEWLPFLILALCPLMHIFMHGGHGHGGHGHGGHGHGGHGHGGHGGDHESHQTHGEPEQKRDMSASGNGDQEPPHKHHH